MANTVSAKEKKKITHPWSCSKEEILDRLKVNAHSGLNLNEVEKRRAEYGRNLLRDTEVKSAWVILLEQFKSIIMILLGAAAALSFFFSQWVDGTAIVVAMIINASIGFFTELKAVRSMESLQRIESVITKVRREGHIVEMRAEDLVPGDIVILESGDLIPADLRILEASKLQVNESPLTGESVPVSKQIDSIEKRSPLAERENMLYKGTAVTRGSGEGIAVATGMDTEIGVIASLVQEAREGRDPLEKRLNLLGRKLVWVVIAVAVVAGGIGIISGKELFLMVKTTIALIVAAIPEGLPIIATVALVRGMHRMARRNALVRRLSAVQTLGSTNVIFTDKTGTLTENQMTVTRIVAHQGTIAVSGEGSKKRGEFRLDGESIKTPVNKVLQQILEVGVLCNNASLSEVNGIKGGTQGVKAAVGDPMEVALLTAGEKAGIQKERLLQEKPEVREVSFDPQMRMMATFHKINGQYEIAVKGAPEAILSHCTRLLTSKGKSPVGGEERKKWLHHSEIMAEEGLRVIACAKKNVDSSSTDPYKDLIFLGLIGLHDPPRRGIRTEITRCQEAGVRVIMVTGDLETTARKIGEEAGLINRVERYDFIHGRALKKPGELSKKEREQLLLAPIFARVSPEQKLNLISIHQKAGSIVAMIGDGVNDAPALKKADIGVAMGQRGQQVAKEAADVILQDDSFSSILVAIEHGRAIFSNIRKFVIYLLSGNVGEILIVTFASILGVPLPLLPLHILYLNAINDAFPALALGMGESARDTMKRPPRAPDEPIMTKRHWLDVGIYGLLIAGAVFGAFLIALKIMGMNESKAVAVSFLSLAFSRLWHVFNMRDRSSSFLRNQVTRNVYVWGALVLCSGLIMLGMYLPGLANVLQIEPPGIQGWLLVLGMSFAPLIFGQIWKRFESKKKKI